MKEPIKSRKKLEISISWENPKTLSLLLDAIKSEIKNGLTSNKINIDEASAEYTKKELTEPGTDEIQFDGNMEPKFEIRPREDGKFDYIYQSKINKL